MLNYFQILQIFQISDFAETIFSVRKNIAIVYMIILYTHSLIAISAVANIILGGELNIGKMFLNQDEISQCVQSLHATEGRQMMKESESYSVKKSMQICFVKIVHPAEKAMLRCLRDIRE